jgi:putative membrane protein
MTPLLSAPWLLVLVPAVACYAVGLHRVVHRARRPGRFLWRGAALLAGIAALVLDTASDWGEKLEGTMAGHMTQHVVLIMVCAPLFVVARPGEIGLLGLPTSWRRPVSAFARRARRFALLGPMAAWALQAVAMLAWHLPGLYDEAVRIEAVHQVEHLCFLLTAWLFWWHLARMARNRRRGAASAAYLVIALPPGALLGAVLTFPDHTLYPVQAARAAAHGVDPLADQHLAGLVMWVPLDMVYLAVAIWLFGRWFASMDRKSASSAAFLLPTDAREVRTP